ncbi:MAG: hypothetical protein IMX01_01225 [Limnochordaceae bacterium]|nr:hypothetical protein [Limnochordaceae bacterium]
MTKNLLMIMIYGLLVAIGAQLVPVVPAPPAQPVAGPGGRQYVHGTVHVEEYGSGPYHYWLFEPTDPTPERAPVVVFLHGWGALDPVPYQKWIDHLVRRGNVVIYPKYQESVLTSPEDMDAAVRWAVTDAWRRLGEPQHVHPLRMDRLVVLGHSLGAVLGLNLAAGLAGGSNSGAQASGAGAEEIGTQPPPVQGLLLMEPGDTGGRYLGWSIPTVLHPELYGELPASTLVALVVGDQTESLVRQTSTVIWQSLRSIPNENKDFIRMQSDDHGQPALVADHFAPTAVADSFPRMLASGLGGMPTDALDFYGFWKLADALIDVVYRDGRNREFVLGGGQAQTWMGQWSDGQPVKPLQVSKTPIF